MSEAMPIGTPTKFGEFIVKNFLGAGAYGYVFRVSRGDDDYALKWLKAETPQNGSLWMKNEIWALGQLSHPAIPALIDGGQGVEANRPYCVMSLARGGTLERLIDRQKIQGA